MDYRAARRALEARQEARIELGLDRVREHLRRLGDPQEDFPSIQVAGTNGKASVCAIIESALREAGHRVGLYSSPHLFDVRERICLGGTGPRSWIPERDFARLMAKALRADREKHLTYFELLTAVAFLWFSEREVEAAILETGLGGRLDATNVVEHPLAGVITSISLDHVQFLGGTIAQIAAEKAGIIKPGCPVYCGPLPAAALRVARLKAAEAGSPLSVAARPWRRVAADWAGGTQTLRAPDGRRWRLRLLGEGQGANAALARAVLAGLFGALPVDEAAWSRGLSGVELFGRFSVVRRRGRVLILDGAHNAEAMANLARTWRASPWSRGPARWIMGVMRDKDVEGLLAPLAPLLRDVVLVKPPSPRALEPLALARAVRRLAPRARITIESDPVTAIRSAVSAGGPPACVVCGSFYLMEPAMRVLERSRG